MNEETIPREFYCREPKIVAIELLGKVIVRRIKGRELKGIIVETEAYGGKEDPASHAFKGITNRNKVMFGEPGHAYVYFTYGNHWCLNFVAHEEGKPGAVLIRAIEPIAGIEIMKKLRKVEDIRSLCNGPGKLTKALSIDGRFNGLDITKEGELYVVYPGNENKNFEIRASERIGIRKGKEKKWRFYIEGNLFVSRR